MWRRDGGLRARHPRARSSNITIRGVHSPRSEAGERRMELRLHGLSSSAYCSSFVLRLLVLCAAPSILSCDMLWPFSGIGLKCLLVAPGEIRAAQALVTDPQVGTTCLT